MFRDGITYARLMRESTDRVERARCAQDPREHLLASRILDERATWRLWENEHAGLMRTVAEHARLRAQLVSLKQASVRLIHRKALFEYLRDKQVRGTTRMRVLAHFHPARSYEHAVVAEHGTYLRSACSYLCSGHIGGQVVENPGFIEPLQFYGQLYAEYLNIYCAASCGGGLEVACEAALLPLLKHQLDECRRAILDPSRELPRYRRALELRRRNGDTQELDVRRLRAQISGI